MSNPSVSVVVPAYNCAPTIAPLLMALANQAGNDDIEVIVVDDGSSDETSTVVASFPGVVYLRQDNAGPAAARNAGLRRARGDIIFFTDADCVPAPDWIKTARAPLADPAVGVVAGSYGILNPESLLARCVHDEILFRHRVLMPRYPKYFGSFNFCARRKVLEAVGGFDTDYRWASGEDNDLSYRIRNAGFKIYFETSALVAHRHPQRVATYLREQFRHGFWRAKMYRDHPRMSTGDDYTFWKDIVEPPLVISVCITAIFGARFLPARFSALCLLTVLIFLECVYSVRMMSVYRERIFL